MDRFAMAQARPIVAVLLVLFWAWWPASYARAQTFEDVFQVSGIPVDATAADAVAAREQALRQGQIEGLRRLLRRLVPAGQAGRLPSVGPGQIERYVQNFEIADERVASNQYLAQLTVRYEPEAVRELLQAAGLPYAETVSAPLVVLPVYRTADGPKLWAEDNPWWQAWADHMDPDRLLHLVLPLGDLQDMATVTADQAMAGDTGALAMLAARYGADDTMLVIATPGDAQGATPRLELEMRRSGIEQANPPETLTTAPDETLDDLIAEAVVGLQDTLDERWKTANLLRYDQVDTMVVDIPIAQLSDWVEISRGLERLAEVDQIEVRAFARENVRAQIRYIGDQLRLEEALGRLGLALSREGESWLLLPMGARPSQGEPASATSTSF
jgi:Uncharacterized protein conserved in bacteria (DUF2066)